MGRLIAVGDTKQAIFAWRGADAVAVQNVIEQFGCHSLPLSISYRCPKAIVRLAQTLVPSIEASENAPEGSIHDIMENEIFDLVKENHYVLCRTNAPLVKLWFDFVKKERKAWIRGRDFAGKLFELLDGLKVKTIEELKEKIGTFQSDKLAQLKDFNKMIHFDDQCETLLVLAENCKSIEDIEDKLNLIFDDDKDGVMLATIHKAKGLEANTVFLIRPDLIPHKRAKTQVAMEQEFNLKYVAITRVKWTKDDEGSLYFVHNEKEEKES